MQNKNSVAVIGLGFVGLPLASLLVNKGFHVIGIDIDHTKLTALRANKSYLSDLTDDEIEKLMASGRFIAEQGYSSIKHVERIIICVQTPLKEHEPDLTHIQSAVYGILPHLRKGQLIILESSTFPGTTEDTIMPLLIDQGFQIGKDLFLGYSPERIDPGNRKFSLTQIPKIISGVTQQCLRELENFYKQIFQQVIPVSSPRVAEFAKLLENSQRFINISFINEMNLLAEKLKVNLWEVISAASTKPVGFTPYYPGSGAGGHCIPVDPFYLTWIGKREGLYLSMIHYAGMINDMMPHFIVRRVVEELEKRKVILASAKIGIIGITYKKDVNDIRESAPLKVVQLLTERNLQVSVYDPVFTDHIPVKTGQFFLTPWELQKFDAVLVLVDHTKIPWADVIKYSRLVIDTCYITSQLLLDGDEEKVVYI